MLDTSDLRLEFCETGTVERRVDIPGDVHHKVVPYIIVAQAWEGHYELTAGAEAARLAPGECFLTPPGLPLAIRHFADPGTGIMRFRWAHLKVTVLGGLDLASLIRLPLRAPRAWSIEIGRIIADLHRVRAGADLAGAARANVLAFDLITRLIELSPPVEHPLLRGDAERWWRVLRYIRKNLCEPPSVGQLADVAHLSRSAFHTGFMHVMGVTPRRFVEQQRVKAAAERLRVPGGGSIAEVASHFGYHNAFHFSRSFKRVLGVSPREYRVSRPW